MPGASQVEMIGHALMVSLRNFTEPSQNAKLAPPGCMLEAASTGSHQQPPLIRPEYFRWALIPYSASKLACAHQLESHHIPRYSSALMAEAVEMPWARSPNRIVLLVPSVMLASFVDCSAVI